jgi:hypothetical protein
VWKQQQKRKKKIGGAGFVSALREKLLRYSKKGVGKDAIEETAEGQSSLSFDERQQLVGSSEDASRQCHHPDVMSTTHFQHSLRADDVVLRQSRYRPQRIPTNVPYQEYNFSGTPGYHTPGSRHTPSTFRTKSTHSALLDRQLSQIKETPEEDVPTPTFYSQLLSPLVFPLRKTANRSEMSDRGNGPPDRIAPDHDPLSWTGRQISIIPNQEDDETVRWQKQMQNKGAEYESLHEMQQREIQRKRGRTKLIKRQTSWSSFPSMHSSSSAVAWVVTQQQHQQIPRPASMLENYERQDRLRRQTLVHANAGAFHAGQGSVYSAPMHPQDEVMRRKHEEMMRARMPAMQKEAQMEREALARQRSGAGNIPRPRPSRRRGSSSSDSGWNPGFSRLEQRPRTSMEYECPRLRAASMSTDVPPRIMQQGGIDIGRPLHHPRPGLTASLQRSKSGQILPVPMYHSHLQRRPVLSQVTSLRPGSQTDKTKWPLNQIYLQPGQLQYSHFDNPYPHNHYSVGKRSQSRTDFDSAAVPICLQRPRTAPLERRGTQMSGTSLSPDKGPTYLWNGKIVRDV